MFKWMTIILFLLVAAFLMFSIAQGRALRRASLISGISLLRSARADYMERGYLTNYSRSWRVRLSTNVVTIGNTQYQCFIETAGGWGWDGGTLAMTTNQTLVWLDAQAAPKIISPSHLPPYFGRPY